MSIASPDGQNKQAKKCKPISKLIISLIKNRLYLILISDSSCKMPGLPRSVCWFLDTCRELWFIKATVALPTSQPMIPSVKGEIKKGRMLAQADRTNKSPDLVALLLFESTFIKHWLIMTNNIMAWKSLTPNARKNSIVLALAVKKKFRTLRFIFSHWYWFQWG